MELSTHCALKHLDGPHHSFLVNAGKHPHPTQKPEKLLAKLILASSRKGDIVFDPLQVAEQQGLWQRNSGEILSWLKLIRSYAVGFKL